MFIVWVAWGLAGCLGIEVRLGLSDLKPERCLVFVGLRYEAVARGSLDDST